MDSKEYDFSKLPKSEHARAIEAVAEYDLNELLYLHNKYGLSEYSYTCCGLDGLIAWFKKGIQDGQISID